MTDRQAFAVGTLIGTAFAALPLVYTYRHWKRIS